MPYCIHCGKELLPKDCFCIECGTQTQYLRGNTVTVQHIPTNYRKIKSRTYVIFAISIFALTLIFGIIDIKGVSYINGLHFIKERRAGYYYKSGMIFYKKKEYDKAIDDFTRAQREHPDNVYPFYWRGRSYYYTKRYDQAVSDFTMAINLDTTIDMTYYWRGASYFQIDMYDNCINDFTRIISANPYIEDPSNKRTDIYRSRTLIDKEAYDSIRQISQRPSYTDVFNWRGFCYYRKGDYEHAIEDFDKVIFADLNDENRIIAKQKRAEAIKALSGKN